jgi:hypothetical protein
LPTARIRNSSPTNKAIATIAGNGTSGYSRAGGLSGDDPHEIGAPPKTRRYSAGADRDSRARSEPGVRLFRAFLDFISDP